MAPISVFIRADADADNIPVAFSIVPQASVIPDVPRAAVVSSADAASHTMRILTPSKMNAGNTAITPDAVFAMDPTITGALEATPSVVVPSFRQDLAINLAIIIPVAILALVGLPFLLFVTYKASARWEDHLKQKLIKVRIAKPSVLFGSNRRLTDSSRRQCQKRRWSQNSLPHNRRKEKG